MKIKSLLRYVVVLAVSALGTLLLSPGTALAHDVKDGDVSGETWSAGTYHVVGSITVNNGSTLTVEAGAVVKFDPGTELKVIGRLDINGTSGSPVVFTSRDDDAYGESVSGSDGDPNPGTGRESTCPATALTPESASLTTRVSATEGTAPAPPMPPCTTTCPIRATSVTAPASPSLL